MRILFDHRAFSLQLTGGITRYFYELIRHLNSSPDRDQGSDTRVKRPIVLVDDAHTFGGAQVALSWAIRALLQRQEQPVICVCTAATREAMQPITGQDENLSFLDCPPALPLNLFSFPLRLWSFYKLLHPLVRQGGDCWWFNLAGIEFCLAPLLILRLHGLRPVAWLHNGETYLFFNIKSSLPRKVLCRVRDTVANRLIFRLYRGIVTPSHVAETSLKDRLLCSNPPQTGFLYPCPGGGSQPLHLDHGQASLISIDLWMIGRVEYGHKNNLVGLEVLKRLRQTPKGASLTVMGNGPDMNHFLNRTKEMGLADDVHFRNWESNPWKYVPRGAIVLIPSLFESFCLVAREAMICGVKMVLSPLPVFFEWIPSELIARDFSTGAFIEKIEEVFAMSDESIVALYAQVLDKFTEEAFVANFLSILQFPREQSHHIQAVRR